MNHELVFDGVTKTFDGHQAVRDLSITVTAGERVAIIGPSGAGKTTLLRLAGGTIAPDSGQIALGGQPIDGRAALAYPGETLIGRRSALANVLLGRLDQLSWWRGLLEPLAPRTPEPALALLETMGVAEKADARADSLSSGERQRVALARALIQDTPVVLADEPTTNLDPKTSDTVLDVLDSVVGNRTLLTVLHDTDLACERFDRVIGLADGRIQFDRSANAVTDSCLSRLFERGTVGDESKRSSRDSGTASTQNERSIPSWYA